MRKFCVINFNTQALTDACIMSVNKFMPNSHIYVFDNSDQKPFVNKFYNVTVFDNTKGQIIDFNKWLEKYPNRLTSTGNVNGFGSAKHSYAIQKCIELIDDNFVLLDSDILLKKDVSHFFDENYLCIGGTERFQRHNTMRITPFICFLNVKMFKKYGLTYFNDEYMYGLNKNDKSEHYDTGGYLYILSKTYKSKIINNNEFIVHFRAGSWLNDAMEKHKYKPKCTVDKWLEINKKYWYDEKPIKNKKVIYTCITGKYDNLMELSYRNNDFDYVCFTDNTDIKSKFWQIKPIPNELKDLSAVKQQRCIKICPHRYLSEYDLSIWIDGVVDVLSDVNTFINDNCKNGIVFIPKHPSRNCIYKEGDVCVSMKKDTSTNINKQLNRYREEGYPKNYGLVQSNIIVRVHNVKECVGLMEAWANEVINESHRDQLSFNYCLWKTSADNFVYLDKKTCNSEYFKWYSSGHNRKNGNKNTVVKPKTKTSIPSIVYPIKSKKDPMKTIVKKPIVLKKAKENYETKIKKIRHEKNKEILRRFMAMQGKTY